MRNRVLMIRLAKHQPSGWQVVFVWFQGGAEKKEKQAHRLTSHTVKISDRIHLEHEMDALQNEQAHPTGQQASKCLSASGVF